MDEIDHDRDVHVSVVGFGVDALDLMVVAIDQGHPAALMAGVTAGGLIEDTGDDLGGVVDHARGDPLGGGPRCR